MLPLGSQIGSQRTEKKSLFISTKVGTHKCMQSISSTQSFVLNLEVHTGVLTTEL
jgi:hypothetical protein